MGRDGQTKERFCKEGRGGRESRGRRTGTEAWRRRGGTNGQRLESRGKLVRSSSREGVGVGPKEWGRAVAELSGGKVAILS